MADQVTNYQCPACGGPLHFDNAAGKVKCDYCESVFEVAEIERIYAQKDEKAEESFAREAESGTPGMGETGAASAGESGQAPEEPVISDTEKAERLQSRWDASTISADWGEAAGQMRSYSCPSCGGEVICEQTTAATHCPYCGNPSIVPGQFAGTLKPDYVIPFKLDKQAAMSALKDYYKKRIFLPKAFSDNNQIKKIQGIYVPFWLFDAEAAAEFMYEGQNSTTHRQGDYRVTVTKHFDVQRNGKVSFSRVPTDASKKMPDDLMDSLEPYDYGELQPFSTAFLPGYLAERFDVSVEDSENRVDRRCRTTVAQLIRSDVTGYQLVSELSRDIYIARGKVHYALLPVWIMKTKWDNKDYLFAMNGQTGKLVGNLPVSPARFCIFCGLLTIPLTLIFYLLNVGSLFSSIIFGLLG